jgi:integrase/recombinase XerD
MVTNKKISSPGRPKNSGMTCRALTRDEVKRLLTFTLHNEERQGQAERNHALLQFGIFTCARISEITGLRLRDVLENGKVSSSVVFQRTKSKKSRRIPLNPALKSLLQRFIDASPHHSLDNLEAPLFPSQKGGHLHPTAASKLVKTLLVDAGLQNAGASHVLRKTGLTLMLANGVHLRTLQEISGHANISTLNAYLSTTTNQVEGAINGLRL